MRHQSITKLSRALLCTTSFATSSNKRIYYNTELEHRLSNHHPPHPSLLITPCAFETFKLHIAALKCLYSRLYTLGTTRLRRFERAVIYFHRERAHTYAYVWNAQATTTRSNAALQLTPLNPQWSQINANKYHIDINCLQFISWFKHRNLFSLLFIFKISRLKHCLLIQVSSYTLSLVYSTF